MLRYILFDTCLFGSESAPDDSRQDLLFALEALTQLDQSYLKTHPGTPLLYNSGVVYERPGQFIGECEEVQTLKKALGWKTTNPKIAGALSTVQQVLGGERFRDIGRILEKGAVDCDNLACWRAAELRQNGIKASPYITWRPRLDGGVTYHVLVRWPDGTTEDPSLLLGMGGEARRADRDKEIAKNAQRTQLVQSVALRGSL